MRLRDDYRNVRDAFPWVDKTQGRPPHLLSHRDALNNPPYARVTVSNRRSEQLLNKRIIHNPLLRGGGLGANLSTKSRGAKSNIRRVIFCVGPANSSG